MKAGIQCISAGAVRGRRGRCSVPAERSGRFRPVPVTVPDNSGVAFRCNRIDSLLRPSWRVAWPGGLFGPTRRRNTAARWLRLDASVQSQWNHQNKRLPRPFQPRCLRHETPPGIA